MKKMMIADIIKASEVPVPGDPEDAGIENVIDLSPVGIATYEHNPEHDVYIVTLKLEKGGESIQYVLDPQGLKDLIELGKKYFYQEMESNTFDMQKAINTRLDKIKEYIRLYDINPEDMKEIDELSQEYYVDNLEDIRLSYLDRPFQIFYLMQEYDINSDEASYLVDNWDNEADWKQVMETAEALGLGIEDVEDDDVDNLNEIQNIGGEPGNSYVEIDTSLGKAFIYYALGQYYLLVAFDEGNPANYPIDKSEVSLISSASSFGAYFNQNMRNSEEYSDMPGAWGCIGPNSDSPKRLMTAEDKAKLPQDLQLLV